jgi:hypothetical protein
MHNAIFFDAVAFHQGRVQDVGALLLVQNLGDEIRQRSERLVIDRIPLAVQRRPLHRVVGDEEVQVDEEIAVDPPHAGHRVADDAPHVP